MLNEQLLTSIDLIKESVDETELDVLLALGKQYNKIGIITEYVEPEVLCEFEVFQESDSKKRGFFGTIGHGIKSALKFIWKCIVAFFKWVGDIMASIGRSIKKFFGDDDDDDKEEKTDVDALLHNARAELLNHHAIVNEKDLAQNLCACAEVALRQARLCAEHEEQEANKNKDKNKNKKKDDDDNSSSSSSKSSSKSTSQQQKHQTAISNVKSAVSDVRQNASKETLNKLIDVIDELRKMNNSIGGKVDNTLYKEKGAWHNQAAADKFKKSPGYATIESQFSAVWKDYVANHSSDKAFKNALKTLQLTRGKVPINVTPHAPKRVTVTLPKVKDELYDKIKIVEESLTKDDFAAVNKKIHDCKGIGNFYVASMGTFDTNFNTKAKEMREELAKLKKNQDYVEQLQHNRKLTDKEIDKIGTLINNVIANKLTSSIEEMRAYLTAVKETVEEYGKVRAGSVYKSKTQNP